MALLCISLWENVMSSNMSNNINTTESILLNTTVRNIMHTTASESPETTMTTLNVFIPLVSYQLVENFMKINVEYLNLVFSVFGLLANTLNVAVFLKQGFTDNVNISLFALSVSDFCSLLTSMLFSLTCNTGFVTMTSIEPFGFQSVVAAFPRGVFSRVSSCVTAYVTFERCVCVVMPLKVKRVLTRRVTVLVLFFIYTGLGLTLLPVYLQMYLGWSYNPYVNKTTLGLQLINHVGLVDVSVTLSIHTMTQIASFFMIIIFTTILVFELTKRSKWRQKSSSADRTNTNKKGSQTLMLITSMAVIYIVCYLPSMTILLTGLIEPKFGALGQEVNLYLVFVTFNLALESLNSCVSVFLYHQMSSKFRATFRQLFYTPWSPMCGTDVQINKLPSLLTSPCGHLAQSVVNCK